MPISKLKSKKAWSDKGVSEIVGTILILAITVVLFSSIMAFVLAMPVPTNKPIADFRADLNVVPGGIATLTILHNGGQSLFNYSTEILVFDRGNTGTPPQHFTVGEGFRDGSHSAATSVWQIGEIWSANINDRFNGTTLPITALSSLEVDVVDVDSNSMIWSSMVGSGSGSSTPVILQRWADGNRTTLTVDPIVPSGYIGFSVYVRVTDADGYTNALPALGKLYTGASTTDSVWLETSSIAGTTQPKLRDNYSNGVWRFDFPKFSDPKTYDGKPLIIHANNSVNTIEVKETYILTVQQPDISIPTTNNQYDYNITYNGTEPTGEAGLPSYLKWFDADQGYVLLGANLKSGTPPTKPNLTDNRNSFTQGEYVFVRVGSFKLQNIFAKNNLTLIDHQSGATMNPCNNVTPFYRIPQTGGVFVYEAKFSTATLLGGYDLKISLQSTVTSGSSLISFNTVANLIVQPSVGPPLVLPELRINATNPLNRSALQMGTFDDPFDLSNASKSVIWVDLRFLDSGTGLSLNIGKVELKDLRDRTVLSGIPPASDGLNGTLGRVYSNMTKDYVFKIDLRLRNGYNLVPGTATYTLTISNAFDGNEGIYTMSIPVWIKSATYMKNYIVATSGFGGSGNFNDISYLFQIENNKFFTTRVLEKVAQSPSTPVLEVYRVIYFDIDGDGDKDVVASIYTPGGYGWAVYINRMNEYGVWEPRSFFSEPAGKKITALADGDVDGDGAIDFAIANTVGEVYLYYNTFPITTRIKITTPDLVGKSVFEMRLTDMTGDGKADLVVLAGGAERLKNGPSLTKVGTFGRMYIYDLSTVPATKLTTVNPDTRVYDFDVADMNGDGLNDYATSSYLNGIGWYQAIPTSVPFYADQDIYVLPTVVVPAANGYLNTGTVGAGYEEIGESGGNATHVWRTQSISGKGQMLRVDAKVNTGCTEAFYFYYSTSPTGPWTYMFYVPPSATGSFQSFHYSLRSVTSGPVYIMVTDAVKGDASSNSIFIDFIDVTTISGMDFNAATSYHNLRLDADSLGYLAIGIGRFNQDSVPDIAVGRGPFSDLSLSPKIMIVDGLTGSSIRTDTNADIRATGDTFVVRDVNGDNLADIVYVLKYAETAVIDSFSIVTEWLNTGMGVTGSTIELKNLVTSYGGSASNYNYGLSEYGAINCIAVENPFS